MCNGCKDYHTVGVQRSYVSGKWAWVVRKTTHDSKHNKVLGDVEVSRSPFKYVSADTARAAGERTWPEAYSTGVEYVESCEV